jgi:hypothetical protein
MGIEVFRIIQICTARRSSVSFLSKSPESTVFGSAATIAPKLSLGAEEAVTFHSGSPQMPNLDAEHARAKIW